MKTGSEIDTTKKFNAATNKHASTTLSAVKLDNETEQFHHDRVSMDVSKLISTQRQKLGITQKVGALTPIAFGFDKVAVYTWSNFSLSNRVQDLATKICEKPQIVNEYEAGKAIPNQQILGKLERALGIKLRGKDKGMPLAPKGSK